MVRLTPIAASKSSSLKKFVAWPIALAKIVGIAVVMRNPSIARSNTMCP